MSENVLTAAPDADTENRLNEMHRMITYLMGRNAELLSQVFLRWFDYAHLPEDLQKVSKRFHDLAYEIDIILPESVEKTEALRKLLESKDAAVRAAVAMRDSE